MNKTKEDEIYNKIIRMIDELAPSRKVKLIKELYIDFYFELYDEYIPD